MTSVRKKMSWVVLVLFFSGCAAGPRINPVFLNGSKTIRVVHVAAVPILVETNINDQNSLEKITKGVSSASDACSEAVKNALTSKGYVVRNRISFLMDKQDGIASSDIAPETQQLEKDLTTEFLEVLALTYKHEDRPFDFFLGKRVKTLRDQLDPKPDAFVFFKVNTNIEGAGAYHQRLVKETLVCMALSAATLGTVLFTPTDVGTHDNIVGYVGMVDAQTGELLYLHSNTSTSEAFNSKGAGKRLGSALLKGLPKASP